MPGSRKLKLWIILGAIAVTAIAVTATAVTAIAWYRRNDHQEMVELTRAWARLAPFPKEATELDISSEGSMMTRAFRASFRAPPDVIEKWLVDSPGTRESEPVRPSPGLRKYKIRPGGGAQSAEVTVNGETNTVHVYAHWS